MSHSNEVSGKQFTPYESDGEVVESELLMPAPDREGIATVTGVEIADGSVISQALVAERAKRDQVIETVATMPEADADTIVGTAFITRNEK